MDIPINGHQLTNEDITKNDAIKNFWRKHQEIATSEESININMASQTQIKIENQKHNSKLTPPKTSPFQNDGNFKKSKLSDFKDLLLEDTLATPVNMPDIVPFTEISKSSNTNKSFPNSGTHDYSNLSFLSQSIKEVNNVNHSRKNYYKPNLDSLATNLDFLFTPTRNSSSLDLNGSTPFSNKNPSHQQLDQVFSEIFSSFPEI